MNSVDIFYDHLHKLEDLAEKINHEEVLYTYDFNSPIFNKKTLGHFIGILFHKAQPLTKIELDEEGLSTLTSINNQLEVLIKNFKNSSGGLPNFTPNFSAIMMWVDNLVETNIGTLDIIETKKLQKTVHKKLESILADVNKVDFNKDQVLTLIKNIDAAEEALNSLPIELENLTKTKTQISDLNNQFFYIQEKSKESYKEIEQILIDMKTKEETAQVLVEKSREALNIATSHGLAESFLQKVKKLNTSSGWWILALCLSLLGAVVIGIYRFGPLSEALVNPQNINLIWIQLIISILSFAAPIWIAWMATKQISYRFRLAEDYAYKATLAKAFEGFRHQGKSINADLEKMMYETIINNLNEVPIRHLGGKHYGSPIHELMNSLNDESSGIGAKMKEIANNAIESNPLTKSIKGLLNKD